jgi:hypothetical protein
MIERSHMFNMALASGLIGSLLVLPASAPTAVAAIPQSGFTAEVVTVNGSGCPAGTATAAASSDNTAFTVTYSDFEAAAGVGANPTDFRKNCQINLRITIPQGFTYAVAEADYQGSAQLPDGAIGTERSAYYIQGSSATTYLSHTFQGPFNGPWSAVDRFDASALVFAPCGVQRNFNINTELLIDPGTSNPTTTSVMSMTSTQGSVHTIYHLSWMACA